MQSLIQEVPRLQTAGRLYQGNTVYVCLALLVSVTQVPGSGGPLI